MKKLTVVNYKNIEGTKMGDKGNAFTYKPLFPKDDIKQCAAGFVEVKPGNCAFSYHYHENNEEIFYIISGSGVIRTSKGEIKVKAGDAITFPSGKQGAHVIRNDSETETLIYIDFDTNNATEIVHFPDTNKVMVIGPCSNAIYDEK